MVFLLPLLLAFNLAFTDSTYHVTGVDNPPVTYVSITQAEAALPSSMAGQGVHTIMVDSGTWSGAITIDIASGGTDVSNYIQIIATPGQEHKGDTAVGVKIVASSAFVVSVKENYTKLRGLIIRNTNTGIANTILPNSNITNVGVERCLVITSANGFFVACQPNSSVHIRNSAFMSTNNTGSYNCMSLLTNSTIFNSVVYNDLGGDGSHGCHSLDFDGTSYAKNVVFFGNVTGFPKFDTAGTSSTDFSNNASVDNSAPGVNSLKSVASANFKFVDTINGDFHLSDTSSVLWDAGYDLSGTFVTDIDSNAWVDWSIGYDEIDTTGSDTLKAITIVSPESHRVWQHNASDSCLLTINGTVENIDTVQWRWQERGWNDLPVSAGLWSDTITIDTGGGFMYFRSKADTTVIDSQRCGCGIVIGFFPGQSNMSGRASVKNTSSYDGNNFAGACGLTLYNWGKYDDPINDPNNNGGSWGPQFATEVMQALKMPVGVVAASVGGYSLIDQYLPGGLGFDTMMTTINQCSVDTIGYLIAHIGETDALNTKTGGYTIDSLVQAHETFLQGFQDSIGYSPKIMLTSVTTFPGVVDSINFDTIWAANFKLPVSNSSFVYGPVLYDMLIGGDSVHIGSQATKGVGEIDTTASRAVRFFLGAFYDSSEYRSPYINYGEVVSDSIIRIGFRVSANKLKTNGTIKPGAFIVADSLGGVGVDSVVMINDTSIYIYTDTLTVGDTVKVSIASALYGHEINLSDSSSYGEDYNSPPEHCFGYVIDKTVASTIDCFEVVSSSNIIILRRRRMGI